MSVFVSACACIGFGGLMGKGEGCVPTEERVLSVGCFVLFCGVGGSLVAVPFGTGAPGAIRGSSPLVTSWEHPSSALGPQSSCVSSFPCPGGLF